MPGAGCCCLNPTHQLRLRQIHDNSKQTVQIRAILFETLGSVQGVRVGWTRHRAHATLVVSPPLPSSDLMSRTGFVCSEKYSQY